MSNKEIIRQFIENLDSDKEKSYALLAENVEAKWPGSGMDVVKGKEDLVKLFIKNGHDDLMRSHIENLLEDGDMVAAFGSEDYKKEGREQKAHFADFYRIKDGKIVELISHVLPEKESKK